MKNDPIIYPIPIFANCFSPEFLLLKFSAKSHHSHFKPWFLPWFLLFQPSFSIIFPSYFRHISIIFPCPHHGSGAVRNPCLEGVGAAPRFGSGESVESVESVVFALRCSSKRGMLIEKKRI